MGLSAKRIRSLLQSTPLGDGEYNKLQDRLEQLQAQGKVDWLHVDSGSYPISPRGLRGKIDFIPVAPDQAQKQAITVHDLRKSAGSPRSRLEANDLSLVVVLAVNLDGGTLNVLLGADATTGAIESAIAYWRECSLGRGIAPEFNAIKVPHHGSVRSHFPLLCQMRHTGHGVTAAVVSSGTRRALPDRSVLDDFLRNGWKVMATTTRRTGSPRSLPITLANRGRSDEEAASDHNTVRLTWSVSDGLATRTRIRKHNRWRSRSL